jgi:hypothetical protein
MRVFGLYIGYLKYGPLLYLVTDEFSKNERIIALKIKVCN